MTQINRKIPPKIKDIKNIDYLKPDINRLDNGIDIYVINGGTAEVVQVDFVFDAGAEFSNKSLLPAFANNLCKEAPKGTKPDDFSEMLDFYGCIFNGFVSNRFAGFKLLMPNNYAGKILPVISDLIKNPALPKKEFEISQKTNYQKIQRSLLKNKFLANKIINTQLFGNKNPFGLDIKPDDIYKINLNEISEYVINQYNSNDCKIIISGMAEKKVIDLLNKNLGQSNWGNNNHNNHNKYPVKESSEKYKIIEKKDSLQSSIFVGKFLDIKNEEDIFSILVLNTALGGYFGSRLMKNIREDKGYTYGIGSFITAYPDKYVLKITTDVGINFTKQTIDEIFKEITKLQKEKIDETELKLVKNYMMGDMLNSFNGPFPTAATYLKLLETNHNHEFIDNQINKILNITPEEIKKCAVDYFEKDKFYTVVVGKIG